jgi:hypothetical protein
MADLDALRRLVDGKGEAVRPEALREATRHAAAKVPAGGHCGRFAPGAKPNRAADSRSGGRRRRLGWRTAARPRSGV